MYTTLQDSEIKVLGPARQPVEMEGREAAAISSSDTSAVGLGRRMMAAGTMAGRSRRQRSLQMETIKSLKRDDGHPRRPSATPKILTPFTLTILWLLVLALSLGTYPSLASWFVDVGNVASISSGSPNSLDFADGSTGVPHSFEFADGSRTPAGLDFAVIGFPKTGTTFLLQVLGRHPEVVMPKEEFCQIHKEDGDNQLSAWLRNAVASLESTSEKSSTSFARRKYGIKCPSMARNTLAIENLVKMSSDTKLVVGVRHPVWWFQSFYNYRVQEHYALHLNDTIPKALELANGKREWKGVATAYARFDVYLRQLDKVSINPAELKDMLVSEQLSPTRISHNPFDVLIYASEQLHDEDATRQARFQVDLQEFLGLQTPFPNFNDLPKSNPHNPTPYPEYINICDQRYQGLRNQLVQRGRQSSRWILEKFVRSESVVVSGLDHFASILRTWGEDPCTTMERLKGAKVKPQRYVPPYLPQRREGDFVNHFRHAIRSDHVSDERILPLLLSHGRLLCRRRHKEEILKSNVGWQARAVAFKDMVNYGMRELSARMNSTLPILLMLGDGNKCNVTTKYDSMNFPRMSWHEPAPKHGTDWCKVIPTPSFISWWYLNTEGGKTSDWRKSFHSYSNEYPWTSKIKKAVWRGSSTYDRKYFGAKLSETPRGRLVETSMNNPEHIDAGFVQLTQQYKSQADELANQTILMERMPFDDQMRYKAILDIDGNSWSSRFPKLLCTNSVVIKIDPDYAEHFYGDLQPMIHYVPASLENVTEVAAYVLDKGNDDAMKEIVQSANRWCEKKMTKDSLAKETLLKLEEYSHAVHSHAVHSHAVRNIAPNESIDLTNIAKDLEEWS